MEELDHARYISLATCKRDGSWVASPVWITGADGTYVFTTGDKAWKTRRLRANARVQVRACSARGRVKPSAKSYVGTGEVLVDIGDVARAERALLAKYGWQFRATKVVDRLHTVFGRREPQKAVAIRLVLSESE
jgi:PPOX class probable F420-dependent enzyme